MVPSLWVGNLKGMFSKRDCLKEVLPQLKELKAGRMLAMKNNALWRSSLPSFSVKILILSPVK